MRGVLDLYTLGGGYYTPEITTNYALTPFFMQFSRGFLSWQAPETEWTPKVFRVRGLRFG